MTIKRDCDRNTRIEEAGICVRKALYYSDKVLLFNYFNYKACGGVW